MDLDTLPAGEKALLLFACGMALLSAMTACAVSADALHYVLTGSSWLGFS